MRLLNWPGLRAILVTSAVLLGVRLLADWLRGDQAELGRSARLGVTGLVLVVGYVVLLRGQWYPALRARLAGVPLTSLPQSPPAAGLPRAHRSDPSPVPWVGAQPWGLYAGDARAVQLSAAPRGAGELAGLPVARDCELSPHPDARVADVAEAVARLRTTPAVLAQRGPIVWPICCDHLATLVLAAPDRADLDVWEARHGKVASAVDRPQAGLDADLGAIRAGNEPKGGVNVFCCPVCHRVSGVHSLT